MKAKRLATSLVLLACGAAPLVTTATCNPYYGTFDFFRDDDGLFYDDGWVVDEVVYVDGYDDCFLFLCF